MNESHVGALWLSTAGPLGFAGGVLKVKHPRMTAAVVSAAGAFVLMGLMPSVSLLERIDLRLFEWLSGESGKVVGGGTHQDPRQIELISQAMDPPSMEVLYLDDEPSGYFEQMPPPPTDVMVMLDRLQKREAGAVAIGYPLQWEEPDTLAVEAMRRVMDRSEVVLGFPLKDSTAPAPVAAPFQRASIAYASVQGDGTKLPVVSNIRGLAPEMGGATSLAGFTRLETEEPDDERAYLLARWSDRVVFSLPVALEVARRGLSFDEVTVHMGRDVRIGEGGPRIPIDFRGRVLLPEDSGKREALPATAVIAESLPEGFAKGEVPLYFTDERLLGAKAEREWAEALVRVDAAVRGAPRRAKLWAVARPHPVIEVLLVLLLAGAFVKWFRPTELKRQAQVLLGCLLGLILVLGMLARFGLLAPMPLAFLSLPFSAMAVMAWAHFGRGVQVVDSEAIKKAEAERNETGSKPSKKRRRKGK